MTAVIVLMLVHVLVLLLSVAGCGKEGGARVRLHPAPAHRKCGMHQHVLAVCLGNDILAIMCQ